jgi:CubicO group peptidase (beta-lactamase class C family)
MSDKSSPPSAAELGIGQRVDLPEERRANFQNWTLAPYNRWTFQRVQQFTRTARIPRSPQASTLNVSAQDFGSLVFEDSQGAAITINDMLRNTWTDGFLVMHRGEVLVEQYFNDMQSDTLHLMMSCSKSLTSTMVGIAIKEGQLHPGEQLTTYLPELQGTGMSGATLQQALDMRVGVKFSEDYDDLDADWRHCELATGWREPPADYTGPQDMVGYMETLRSCDGPHGGIFHYQSILTDVLGTCLERVTGRSFTELFAERIWQPLGTEQDLVTIIDGAGTAIFEGGFNCCLRDFARFGQLICSGGVANGRQLIPADWIDDCRFANADLLKAFSASDYGEAMAGHAYHNQWWVRDPKRGVIMALGIHGQTIYIDPEREFIVAKFSSQPEQANIGMALDQVLGFEAIAGDLYVK